MTLYKPLLDIITIPIKELCNLVRIKGKLEGINNLHNKTMETHYSYITNRYESLLLYKTGHGICSYASGLSFSLIDCDYMGTYSTEHRTLLAVNVIFPHEKYLLHDSHSDVKNNVFIISTKVLD